VPRVSVRQSAARVGAGSGEYGKVIDNRTRERYIPTHSELAAVQRWAELAPCFMVVGVASTGERGVNGR